MSNDLNQCTFVGRLGKDVEGRTFPNGDPVANFSIAVGESWKDKTSGEKREKTEWVNIVTTGGLAKVCTDYLRKGSQVLIVGKLRTRKWTDKDGNDKYTTEILADHMQMIGGRQDSQSASPAQSPAPRPAPAPAPAPRAPSSFDDMVDDIPFRDPLSFRGTHSIF
jgi:single-strand DNA-binding protein